MKHFERGEELEARGIGEKLMKKRMARGKKGGKGKGKAREDEAAEDMVEEGKKKTESVEVEV